jgi:Tfp pilus assembly protein FimT
MELLIVMAIITILCGIIAPQLGAFANGRKGADAARTIVAMAHYARAQSIGEGRIYRMSTDGPTNSVILSAQEGGEFQEVMSENGKRFVLPDGLMLVLKSTPVVPASANGLPMNNFNNNNNNNKNNSEIITFTPNGRCDPGSITIMDNNRHTVVVGCESATELYHILQPGEVIP